MATGSLVLDSFTLEVDTTATLVYANPAGSNRTVSVYVANTDANIAYFGGATVTTTTGWPVAATSGVSPEIPVAPGQTLYGISATAASTCIVFTAPR